MCNAHVVSKLCALNLSIGKLLPLRSIHLDKGRSIEVQNDGLLEGPFSPGINAS